MPTFSMINLKWLTLIFTITVPPSAVTLFTYSILSPLPPLSSKQSSPRQRFDFGLLRYHLRVRKLSEKESLQIAKRRPNHNLMTRNQLENNCR